MTEALERAVRHGIELGERAFDDRSVGLTAAVHRRLEVTHVRRASALKMAVGIAAAWAILAALGAGGSDRASESAARGTGETALPAVRPIETDALAGAMIDRRRDASAPPAAQAALHCPPTGAASGPLACDAAWIPGGELLDGSATTVRIRADGSAIVEWEIRNTAPEEWIVLSNVAAALLTDPGAIAVGDAIRSSDAYLGTSLWLDEDTRRPVLADDWLGVTLAPGERVVGTARLPAGAVAPGTPLVVSLQAWLASPSDRGFTVALEVSAGTAAGVGTTDEMLAGATARTPGESSDGGQAALLCDPPDPTAVDEVVADLWGTGWTWAPACEALWLAAGRSPLDVESLRSDIDRSPDSRVVRWRARNMSDRATAVDADGAIVVLELEPPVEPRAVRVWESVTPTMARIDTLWRSAGARTGLMRHGAAIEVVRPGEAIGGEQVFFFDLGGERAQTRAATWGPYLERSRATVMVRVADAAEDGRVLLLELSAG